MTKAIGILLASGWAAFVLVIAVIATLRRVPAFLVPILDEMNLELFFLTIATLGFGIFLTLRAIIRRSSRNPFTK